MTGPWHPTGRGRVNMRSPAALAVCDRCSFTYNHRDLSWQFQWSGVKLQNLWLLVCRECLDTPQPQIKTIVIPPDPLPIQYARPEAYSETVPSFIAEESTTFSGDDLAAEDGDNLIWEIQNIPLPDPNDPSSYPT